MRRLLRAIAFSVFFLFSIPNIFAQSNQTLANGGTTTAVNFAGTGCSYSWVNSNPSVGLPASGTGNISSFTAINTSNAPVTVTITATPVPTNYAYISNYFDGTVSVVNTITNTVAATIPVGVQPLAVTVNADGSRVYVANTSDHTISVINALTNQVVATIGGVYPEGLIVSPDGSKLFVANLGGTISVISTATNTIIAVITTSSNLYSLAISSDGAKLYAPNISSNSVFVINTTSYSVSSTITVGSQPDGIVLSPDNTKAYVANGSNTISVISTTGNTVTNTIDLSFSPGFICISPDGKELYVTDKNSDEVHIINTATNSVGATVAVTGSASGISISPDGKDVYVDNGNVQLNNNPNSNTVTVINTATNMVTATIPVGSHPVGFGDFISGGIGCNSSPVTFTITVNPAAVAPAITTGTASGTIFACVGTASASPDIQQFTVSGSNLTTGVTAIAPTGFEVSATAGSGYASSVMLNQSSGNLSSTTVYVRSAAGDEAGKISGNVVLSSPGAANQQIPVSGTVNALPIANAVPNQTVANGGTTTTVNFTGTGNNFTWTNDTPGIGLAASGTGNISSFTAVNTGSSPVTATITATPMNVGYAYISNYGDRTVSVINTQTNTVVESIPVGSQPQGVAVSPDGSRVYVTDQESSMVSVINTSTNAVIANINVDSSPAGIVVSLDGSKIYVTSSVFNNVDVISTVTNTILAKIPVGGLPNGIIISPDGSKVYVANGYTSDISVINTATNTVEINFSVGSGPTNLAITPDGKFIYVSNSGEYTAGNTVSVVSTATYQIVSTITVGFGPGGIAVSPDGSRVFVINDDNISVINTATNLVVATIAVGDRPVGVAFTSDGSSAYVTNEFSNNVSVINTSTNTVIATVGTEAPFSFGSFVSGGTSCPGSPTTFTITVNPTTTAPTITASTVTGNITACLGTASASPNIEQFTVSGSGLTANITAIVTTPLNFQISLNATSGFGSSLILPQTNGTVSNTIIYVRSAATAPAEEFASNVKLTSAGGAYQSVGIGYTIYAIPSVDAVISQTFANGAITSAINFSGTAATYNWVNDTPGIGLAASGTGNIPVFTAINSTQNPITATITVTPLNSTNCNGTPIIFTITVNPTALPSTLTATANLDPLTTIYGTSSSVESFTVSGTNISGGILVTPPPGFEVSTNGTAFNTTTTISGNGGISSATVYIRLAATTPVSLYSGNIVLSTANTNSVNVFMPAGTVTPAPLTITANNITKPLNAVNPPLTITYAGFVNNDGPAQLTAQPVVTTTALTQSPIGQYPITVSDAISPNYTFTYIPGILSIQPSISAIAIPNTFTPNGDGINDTWQIKYLEYYPKSTVNIFDRWGQKVFSSIGYPIPWDGTYKGAVLPTGTYYYIIDPKTGQAIFSGWLAIIR